MVVYKNTENLVMGYRASVTLLRQGREVSHCTRTTPTEELAALLVTRYIRPQDEITKIENHRFLCPKDSIREYKTK